jgi:hypothetical protein
MNFRHSSFPAILLLLATPDVALSQQSKPIRRLEAAVWSEIADRARRSEGLTLARGEFDLRLPVGGGGAEEVRGATRHAHDALAIASVRLEPGDSLDSSTARIGAGRYDLRIEDRAGNCVGIHQEVRVDDAGIVARGARMVEACRPLYMAEVVRRGRRIVRLPLAVGDLADHWSVASATTGWADVYADSVVVLANSITLKASYPSPDTATGHVDSIAVGLAMGDDRWSTIRRSVGRPVGASLRPGATWSGTGLRFMIPIDSTVDLGLTWPVVEVVLRVAKTAGNPQGRAWTYAHGARGYFASARAR